MGEQVTDAKGARIYRLKVLESANRIRFAAASQVEPGTVNKNGCRDRHKDCQRQTDGLASCECSYQQQHRSTGNRYPCLLEEDRDSQQSEWMSS
jgi:hypothetical protein